MCGRYPCQNSSWKITPTIQKQYFKIYKKNIDVDLYGADRICSGCRSATKRGKKINHLYDEIMSQYNHRQLVLKIIANECDCFWCDPDNRLSKIEKQAHLERKVYQKRKQSHQSICGKDMSNGSVCQIAVGRGIQKHSCSITANARNLQSTAKTAEVSDVLMQAMFVAKEAMLKNLENNSFVEIELAGIGRYPTRIRRSSCTKKKSLTYTNIIDVMRKRCTSKAALNNTIQLIKAADGNVPNYKEIIMELNSRVLGLHSTCGFWVKQKATETQFQRQRIADELIDEYDEAVLDKSIRNITINNKLKSKTHSYEKYVGISYINDMNRLIKLTKQHRKLGDLDNSEYILKYCCDAGGEYTKLALQIHLKSDLQKPDYVRR